MLGLFTLFATALVLLIVIATLLLAWEMRHPPRRTAAWAIARGRPCDPADLDLEFEEWVLDVPDARLPVWEIEGKARRQEGTEARRGEEMGESNQLTIVLVHGWGESRVDLLTRLDPWLSHASSIVLYDLRGHGDATGSASRVGDDEHDDLLRLIERLETGPVVLVGWSMGGVIAVAAAAEAGDNAALRIAGVMTIGAYADFDRSLRGRLRVQNLPARPLTDLAVLVHRFTGVRPRGGGGFANRVRCPLLVIHGEEDAVVPVADAHTIAGGAGQGRVLIVPGGDHCEPRNANVDQFDATVASFLDEVAAARSSNSTAATSAASQV